MQTALQKALGGGVPGMAAMAIQVVTLMWLRTTVNYQYRYGTSTMDAFRALYRQGGVRRFYNGLGPALIQAPLSRFCDTAANAGLLSLLQDSPLTAHLPLAVKTAVGSVGAAICRSALLPVDTLKTIMQVEGTQGAAALLHKTRTHGPGVLYHGTLATAAASLSSHYPWFATYNYLNAYLPHPEADAPLTTKLSRSALIGFVATAVSDVCSNSMRVLKTAKQTSTYPTTYVAVLKDVLAHDGVVGLFGRGLKTKIVANGVQGILFTVCWRVGQDWWAEHHAGHEARSQH